MCEAGRRIKRRMRKKNVKGGEPHLYGGKWVSSIFFEGKLQPKQSALQLLRGWQYLELFECGTQYARVPRTLFKPNHTVAIQTLGQRTTYIDGQICNSYQFVRQERERGLFYRPLSFRTRLASTKRPLMLPAVEEEEEEEEAGRWGWGCWWCWREASRLAERSISLCSSLPLTSSSFPQKGEDDGEGGEDGVVALGNRRTEGNGLRILWYTVLMGGWDDISSEKLYHYYHDNNTCPANTTE